MTDRKRHEQNAKYYAAHREQWRERYAEHREQLSEYYAKHYAEHREQKCEYQAKYYADHKEPIRKRQAKYYAEHREQSLAFSNKRRATKLGLSEHHTQAEWLAKIDLLGNCCFYCGEAKPLTRDHKIPLSRGGGDEIQNILPACKSCNSKKHTQTTEEYLGASHLKDSLERCVRAVEYLK